MEAKEVLDNFTSQEDPLLAVIRKALHEATSGHHVDRAIRVQAVLENALAEQEKGDE